MKLTLPNYQQAKVLIIGDVMLDRYWYGPTKRISPEAPVPVVGVKSTEERAGGAANVAVNITALGGNAHLLGFVGKDEQAETLQKMLTASHVVSDFVTVKDHPTITKLRVMSHNQQLIRVDFEEGFHDVDSKELLAKMKAAMATTKVVILSDYGKGALNSVQSMIKLARYVGAKTLIDPKGVDFERYRGATLLTPNMSEFEDVVGACKTEEEIFERGIALIKKLDLEALLVTRSENGMVLLREGHPAFNLPTLAREVYDVTGAGDTVISTLAASLSAGKTLEDACALANAAAGVVVGKLGTSTLSSIELMEAIHHHQRPDQVGVVTKEQLIDAVEMAKMRGEKVVMTNGCFDILHAGHVSYLNSAAELGDRLVVAVNTDESVKILKGEGRPINNTENRMAVLSALSAVDWVVPFAEETPQQLISEVLPNLLVKGGDYKPEDIAGAKEVIAAGGEVQVLQFKDGCSTTKVINSILSTQQKESPFDESK